MSGPCEFLISAVRLIRRTDGTCLVQIERRGQWVTVIVDAGDVISHTVESSGIERAIYQCA